MITPSLLLTNGGLRVHLSTLGKRTYLRSLLTWYDADTHLRINHMEASQLTRALQVFAEVITEIHTFDQGDVRRQLGRKRTAPALTATPLD